VPIDAAREPAQAESMSRKLSAARRERLEKQLDDLRIQYRELRTKELHSLGKQRQQNHLASMEVG
jgi:hypothetical protein